MQANLLKNIVKESKPELKVNASVIWMHGLGADGSDFAGIIPSLRLPDELNIRFIFPSAPSRPVTINDGYVMPAWYDILGMDAASRQDSEGLHASAKLIEAFIEREEEQGIPRERIFLAGFSQGGAQALYMGLQAQQPFAGIIALSTYLPVADILIKHINNKEEFTPMPIFMAHGTEDQVVPLLWGQMSHRHLADLGYQVSWHDYSMEHSVIEQELTDIGTWISVQLEAK